ncbi:Aste57867_10751 [Aphanomyces stellatus]|uniref:Aste57867_10751 protein n=1 Tax=Aphanomyces stellatus TaxID=120398 RepID=A0A485KRX4_9STRA|nr:hypothetical protein As57867_010711 [Aphanomyces stellatus]VFT87621.1 Aste57867_10751 [Aphanomyces stellatus]
MEDPPSSLPHASTVPLTTEAAPPPLPRRSSFDSAVPQRRASVDDVRRLRNQVAVEKKRSVSKEITEMINYIIFLVLFLIATFEDRNDNAFATRTMYLSQLKDKPLPPAAASAFRSFETMSSVREFHAFLTGPFYNVIYDAQSFDGDYEYPNGILYDAPGSLAAYGQIVGPIRIGQLRVAGQNCTGNIAKMSTFFPQPSTCYPEFTSATESTQPFGYPNQSVYLPVITVPSEPSYVSRSARSYGAPRFSLELSPTEPVATEEGGGCNMATKIGCPAYAQLASLNEHKFIDVATRAVFVDFTTYNANTDEQTTVRLFVEITKGGGFVPQVECMSYRLYRNTTPADTIRFVLEMLVLLQVLIQVREEVLLIRRLKWAYLNMVANVAHLFSLIIFGPITFLRVLCATNLPKLATLNLTTFINFRTSVVYFSLADAVTSFTFLLSWLKLFKFLAILPLFAPLTKTVGASAPKVTGLILIFGVALMGSALSFTMAFGLDAENYKTFADSCLGLLKILQGELEFEELHKSNRILGPLFFVIFVTLMFFVILNMFIVVISDAYIETKDELELMRTMKIDTLSKEVVDHILHTFIFRLPGVGARLQRRYDDACNKPDDAPTDVAMTLHECHTFINNAITMRARWSRQMPTAAAETSSALTTIHRGLRESIDRLKQLSATLDRRRQQWSA